MNNLTTNYNNSSLVLVDEGELIDNSFNYESINLNTIIDIIKHFPKNCGIQIFNSSFEDLNFIYKENDEWFFYDANKNASESWDWIVDSQNIIDSYKNDESDLDRFINGWCLFYDDNTSLNEIFENDIKYTVIDISIYFSAKEKFISEISDLLHPYVKNTNNSYLSSRLFEMFEEYQMKKEKGFIFEDIIKEEYTNDHVIKKIKLK